MAASSRRRPLSTAGTGLRRHVFEQRQLAISAAARGAVQDDPTDDRCHYAYSPRDDLRDHAFTPSARRTLHHADDVCDSKLYDTVHLMGFLACERFRVGRGLGEAVAVVSSERTILYILGLEGFFAGDK